MLKINPNHRGCIDFICYRYQFLIYSSETTETLNQRFKMYRVKPKSRTIVEIKKCILKKKRFLKWFHYVLICERFLLFYSKDWYNLCIVCLCGFLGGFSFSPKHPRCWCFRCFIWIIGNIAFGTCLELEISFQ